MSESRIRSIITSILPWLQKIPKRNIHLLSLTTLLLFFTGMNLWFLSIDRMVPLHDMSINYVSTLGFMEEFSKEGLAGKIQTIYTSTTDRSALIQYPAAAMMSLFGRTPDVASFSSILFLYVLVFSLYALGSTLFSKDVGFLAAVTIPFYPIIAPLSRIFTGHLALTGMVVLSWWVILKTAKFSSWRDSLLFGSVIGVTALTKPEFVLYLFLPFMIETLPSFLSLIKERRFSTFRRRMLKLIVAGIVVLIIAYPWYYFHAGVFIDLHITPYFEVHKPTAQPVVNILSDLGRTARHVLSVPVFLTFVLALPLFLLRGKKKAFLLSSIILPTIFLGLYFGSDVLCDAPHYTRYLASYLPLAALIIAFCVVFTSNALSQLTSKPLWKRAARLLPLSLVLMHALLYFAILTSASEGLPLFRGEGFTQWARWGCSPQYPQSLVGRSDLYSYQHRIPIPLAYFPETTSAEIPTFIEKYGALDTIFFFNPKIEPGYDSFLASMPFIMFSYNFELELVGTVQALFHERAALLGTDIPDFLEILTPFNSSRGCQVVNSSDLRGVPKPVSPVSDMIILEPITGIWCDQDREPPAHMQACAPLILDSLDSYDVVYTLRVHPEESIPSMRKYEIFWENVTNMESTWEGRGIREPLDQLHAIILARRPFPVDVPNRDRTTLRRWLLGRCEVNASLENAT